MTTFHWRDMLERGFWTSLQAGLAVLTAEVLNAFATDASLSSTAVLRAAVVGAIGGAIAWLTTVARWRLSVLPNPGEWAHDAAGDGLDVIVDDRPVIDERDRP